MKIINKLILSVLAISLITSSAFASKTPEIVSDLWTHKQTALVAACTAATFGLFAWAINKDLNDEIAEQKEESGQKVTINPYLKYGVITFIAGAAGAFIGKAMHVSLTIQNVVDYVNHNITLNNAIAQNTQEILLGSGI